MTLFALPLSWQNGRISAASSSFPQTSGQSTNRKRKRSSPLNSPSSPKTPATLHTLTNSIFPLSSSPVPSKTNLDYVSTNPLSLNAEEARQYRAAGLELDKELPSKTYTGFPHRSLPWDYSFATDDEDEDGQVAKALPSTTSTAERGTRASHLKVRHLAVLTAVMQRCLAEGDITRASKAWALLLRAEVGGKGVDLRSTGYWSIGAEFLMRRGEQPIKGRLAVSKTTGHEATTTNHNKRREEIDSVEKVIRADFQDLEDVRWGSAEGLERAKSYYARLILQHPYKRQYSSAISALDFWPAMLSCEIYGIQYEQQQSLHQLDMHQNSDNIESTSESMGSLSGEEADNDSDDEINSIDVAQEFGNHKKRESRPRYRQQMRIWKKREVVRKHAKMAAENVAIRMDNIMSAPPFADSHVLHRLRGYLALYIGDLSILTSSVDETEVKVGKTLARSKKIEIEQGVLARDEMREIAGKHFHIARRRGGTVPDWEVVETEIGYEDEPLYATTV